MCEGPAALRFGTMMTQQAMLSVGGDVAGANFLKLNKLITI